MCFIASVPVSASDTVSSTGHVYRTDFTFSTSRADNNAYAYVGSLNIGPATYVPSKTYSLTEPYRVSCDITGSYTLGSWVGIRYTSSSVYNSGILATVMTGTVANTLGAHISGHIDFAFVMNGYVGDTLVTHRVSNSVTCKLSMNGSTSNLFTVSSTTGRYFVDYTNPSAKYYTLTFEPGISTIRDDSVAYTRIEQLIYISSTDLMVDYYPETNPPSSISGSATQGPGSAYVPGSNETGGSPDVPSDPPSSSVDLTETNQKLDEINTSLGDLNTGIGDVNDNLKDVEQAIKDGNEEASTQRKGILEAILGLPQSLLDGIIHLFVPDQEDIMEVKQAYDELLEDRFGLFAQAGTLLVSLFTGISSALGSGSAYTFQFPGIQFPMNGTTYTIVEAQAVSLDNAFFDICRPVLGTGVTIIACCALINTLIRFFEVILGDKFDITIGTPGGE